MTFRLVTDSCCDLPYTFLAEKEVDFISMTVQINGTELIDDLGKTFDYQAFLTAIKEGAMPTTSQVNVGRYIEFFKPYVEKKLSVLYLAFSSGLSGSYQSAVQAVEMLKEEYEEVNIHIIDTKAASLGQGLLVAKAIELKEEGKTLEEILEWISENKMKVQSWVTVDDLKHLERGGRISKTAAALGGLINVKPIITVDEEGKLKNVGKVRGRNKAIQQLANETATRIVGPLNQTIYIAYAGEKKDAEKLAGLVRGKITVKNILMYPLGSTIVSHTGNGCLAIFCIGNRRTEN